MKSNDDYQLPQQVFTELCEALRKYCDLTDEFLAEVSPRTPMASLDLDSISLAYVFAEVERSHGVSFENDRLDPDSYGTVADLVAVLVEEIGRLKV